MVRTPGGHLTFKRIDKKPNLPKCADTGALLNGIRPHTAGTAKRVGRNKRTVSRVYGGVLSAGAVRDRILRAFLVQEQKVVRELSKARKAAEAKKAAKAKKSEAAKAKAAKAGKAKNKAAKAAAKK